MKFSLVENHSRAYYRAVPYTEYPDSQSRAKHYLHRIRIDGRLHSIGDTISVEIKKGFLLDIEFNAKLRCIYIEQKSSQRVVVEKEDFDARGKCILHIVRIPSIRAKGITTRKIKLEYHLFDANVQFRDY